MRKWKRMQKPQIRGEADLFHLLRMTVEASMPVPHPPSLIPLRPAGRWLRG